MRGSTGRQAAVEHRRATPGGHYQLGGQAGKSKQQAPWAAPSRPPALKPLPLPRRSLTPGEDAPQGQHHLVGVVAHREDLSLRMGDGGWRWRGGGSVGVGVGFWGLARRGRGQVDEEAWTMAGSHCQSAMSQASSLRQPTQHSESVHGLSSAQRCSALLCAALGCAAVCPSPRPGSAGGRSPSKRRRSW